MIVFMEKSLTTFRGNVVVDSGAAILAKENCHIKLMQNSKVIYNFNIAGIFGGCLMLHHKSNVTVEGNSLVLFERNQALYGGAICLVILYSMVIL